MSKAWLQSLICWFLGHDWGTVYRNPYSQHPVGYMAEYTDKEADRSYAWFLFRCRRCGRLEWR